MKKILYLHGLGSSGSSSTIDQLRAALKEHGFDLVAPDYSPERGNAYRDFIDLADKCEAVVGTSLGGYHALKLAEITDAAAVVVNPCYKPVTLMEKYVGQELPNYADPLAMCDRFTRKDLNKYEGLNVELRNMRLYPVTWIVGENDDVIDPAKQIEWINENDYACATKMVDWGHRIEDVKYLMDQIFATMYA